MASAQVQGPPSMPATATCAVVVLVGSVAYVAAFGERIDYLAHYLAGFGLSLLLVSLAPRQVPSAARAVLGAVLATATALALETTLLDQGFPDPADVLNSTVGALLAAACTANRPVDAVSDRTVAHLAVGVLALGIAFRYVV